MMPTKVIDSNYGSIPHLSTSKLTQQADKKINEGQERILTKQARDWKDLIIVTEKIDGSNVGIIRRGNALVAIGRSGYRAFDSPYEQHQLFAKWVMVQEPLFSWLPDGYRICGEWCIQAHGTLYDITNESPFVAFDIFDDSGKRLAFFDFYPMCLIHQIPTVPILHIGQPISIANAVKLMGDGHYGKPEHPEGVVYRVERKYKVDFLAKWVRADKQDGKYLDSVTWNKGWATN